MSQFFTYVFFLQNSKAHFAPFLLRYAYVIPDLSTFLRQRYKAHWLKWFSTSMVQRWWHWGGPMTLPICAFHLPEDVYPFQQCTFAVLGRAFPGHLKKHILHFIRPGSLCSSIFQVRMIPFFLLYEGWSTVKNFPSYFPFISLRQGI